MRPNRRALATVAAVALVVGMTLTADPPWLYERIAAVLEPVVRPTLVARALNVALFVPVGVAIGAWRRPWWLVGAAGASVTVELVQQLLPNRNPDPWDVVTNVAGAVAGYLAVAAWRWWRDGPGPHDGHGDGHGDGRRGAARRDHREVDWSSQ